MCGTSSRPGLRDKSIVDGTEIGKPLRPVYLEKAAALIYFVLDRVGRDDFDVGRDHLRSFLSDGYAVPWMRLEHQPEQTLKGITSPT
jgi:hypothetical protein